MLKDLDAEVIEHDPKIALDGGAMGLKFYNIIHDNLRKRLNNGGMLIMEVGEGEADAVIRMFKGVAYSVIIKDFNGVDRYVKVVI